MTAHDAEIRRLIQEYAHDPLVKMYRIFDQLRRRRPQSYRDDFKRVLGTLQDEGPEAANALVTDLLAPRREKAKVSRGGAGSVEPPHDFTGELDPNRIEGH